MKSYPRPLIRSLFRSTLALAHKADSNPQCRQAVATALHEHVPDRALPEVRRLAPGAAAAADARASAGGSGGEKKTGGEDGRGALAQLSCTAIARCVFRAPLDPVAPPDANADVASASSAPQADVVGAAMRFFSSLPSAISKALLEDLWAQCLTAATRNDAAAGVPSRSRTPASHADGKATNKRQRADQCDSVPTVRDFSLLVGLATLAHSFRLASLRTCEHQFERLHMAEQQRRGVVADPPRLTASVLAGDLEDADPILAAPQVQRQFSMMLRDVNAAVDTMVDAVLERAGAAAAANPWKMKQHIVNKAVEIVSDRFPIPLEFSVENFLVDDCVAGAAASPHLFLCFLCEVLTRCGLKASIAALTPDAPLLRIRPLKPRGAAGRKKTSDTQSGSTKAKTVNEKRSSSSVQARIEKMTSAYVDVGQQCAVISTATVLSRAGSEPRGPWCRISSEQLDLPSATVMKLILGELVVLTEKRIQASLTAADAGARQLPLPPSLHPRAAAAAADDEDDVRAELEEEDDDDDVDGPSRMSAGPAALSPIAAMLAGSTGPPQDRVALFHDDGTGAHEAALLRHNRTTLVNNASSVRKQNKLDLLHRFDTLARLQWKIFGAEEDRHEPPVSVRSAASAKLWLEAAQAAARATKNKKKKAALQQNTQHSGNEAAGSKQGSADKVGKEKQKGKGDGEDGAMTADVDDTAKAVAGTRPFANPEFVSLDGRTNVRVSELEELLGAKVMCISVDIDDLDEGTIESIGDAIAAALPDDAVAAGALTAVLAEGEVANADAEEDEDGDEDPDSGAGDANEGGAEFGGVRRWPHLACRAPHLEGAPSLRRARRADDADGDGVASRRISDKVIDFVRRLQEEGLPTPAMNQQHTRAPARSSGPARLAYPLRGLGNSRGRRKDTGAEDDGDDGRGGGSVTTGDLRRIEEIARVVRDVVERRVGARGRGPPAAGFTVPVHRVRLIDPVGEHRRQARLRRRLRGPRTVAEAQPAAAAAAAAAFDVAKEEEEEGNARAAAAAAAGHAGAEPAGAASAAASMAALEGNGGAPSTLGNSSSPGNSKKERPATAKRERANKRTPTSAPAVGGDSAVHTKKRRPTSASSPTTPRDRKGDKSATSAPTPDSKNRRK